MRPYFFPHVPLVSAWANVLSPPLFSPWILYLIDCYVSWRALSTFCQGRHFRPVLPEMLAFKLLFHSARDCRVCLHPKERNPAQPLPRTVEMVVEARSRISVPEHAVSGLVFGHWWERQCLLHCLLLAWSSLDFDIQRHFFPRSPGTLWSGSIYFWRHLPVAFAHKTQCVWAEGPWFMGRATQNAAALLLVSFQSGVLLEERPTTCLPFLLSCLKNPEN